MASIGDYVATFKADFDGLIAPMKESAKQMRQLQATIKPLTDNIKAIGTIAAATGGAVVTSFVAMSKAAANYGDSIRDAAIRTGVSTEALSGLKFAAEQTGTSFEAVSSGLKFLARNAVENAGHFNRLGVSVKDTGGNLRSVNDIFLDTADRISKMRDGAEKTAITLKLMGRGSEELTELLNLGRVGIAGFTADAKEMGLILGKDAADQADEFNDSLNRIKNATLGLSVTIGNSLLPALTDLAKKMTEIIKGLRGWADEYPGLIKGTFALAAAIAGAGGLLLGTAALLAHLKELKLAFGLLTSPIALASGAILGLVGALVIFRNEFAAGVISALAEVARSIGWVILAMSKLSGVVSKEAAKGFQADALAAFATAEKFSQLSDSLLENTEVVISNMDKHKAWLASLNAVNPAIGKTNEELDKMSKTALQAKDDAARLFFALRDIGELDLSHISLPFDSLKEQLPEVTAQVRAIVVAIPEMTAAGGMLDQTLAGIAAATARAAQEQADMFDAIGRDAKVAADEIRKIEKAYDDTFRSVKNTAMHTFLEIFKDGEFRFGALAGAIKGIFATLANEILSTMTAKLLTPLVQKITGALSGILGKIPGLAGVFGGLGVGGGGGLTAVGAIGPTGAGMGAAATAAATAGIAGAVLAAVAVVKSQAHWEANTLIKTVHDPFVASIRKIHDAFFAAAETGNLTSEAAKSAREDTQALWDSFKAQAAAFAKGGSDEARVVQQMFDEMAKHFGPDLNVILGGMDSVIATIQDMGIELERLTAVKEITDKVTMAASGFGDMEQALANLIETGMEWGPIVEFLGSDILTMAHNMEALGLTVPPYIQAVVNQINANNLLTQSIERHGEVVTDLSDVYDQLVSAAVSTIDAIDAGIADSLSAIEGWENAITDASDAIRASEQELKRLANQRASLEDQIKKIEIQGQRDLLVAALDAAKASSSSTSSVLRTMTSARGITAAGHAWSSLNTTITNTTESVGAIADAQKALDEFDKQQRKSEMAERLTQLADLKKQLQETIVQEAAAKSAHDAQIVSGALLVASLGEKIRLEQDHILSMKNERAVAVQMFDALNGVRLTELQTMDNTIDTLLLRASALNLERKALESLTGQTSAVSDSIAEMIANIQAARTGEGVPALSLPSLPSTATPSGTTENKNTTQLNIYGGITVNEAREGNEGTARAIIDAINREVDKGSARLVASEVRR